MKKLVIGMVLGWLLLTNITASSDDNIITFYPDVVIEEKQEEYTAHDIIPKIDLAIPAEETYLEYTATAYCSCEKCCGKWASLRDKDLNGNDIVKGASGEVLISNYSVASPLAFGTKLTTKDGQTYEVMDKTADWVAEKYNYQIIDVYVDTHEKAKEFGKQKILIKIEGDLENE